MHCYYPKARAIARQVPNPEAVEATAQIIYQGIKAQGADPALALRIACEVSQGEPRQEEGEG